MNSSKEWTNDEKDILIKNYPTMGATYCSNLLGRSVRACSEMAKKIKLKRRVNFRYEDELKLKELVNSCSSYTDCVIKLGLSPRCSGNYQTIKKYIKKYNIDISHFTGGNYKLNNIPKNKVDLRDILVKDSFFTRSHLKERLYKEGLKKKECEICGMGENWFNESKIVHILDHINGDPYDNRIENLRIVCPNCNSTLDTNNGRNKVKKIYDPETGKYKSEKTHKKCNCGKIILKESKMCSKCNGERQRKIERPNYETLKKDIETLGYKGAGKKYGLTDNGIRKWLKNYEMEFVAQSVERRFVAPEAAGS
jgi:HNH endonuclease